MAKNNNIYARVSKRTTKDYKGREVSSSYTISTPGYSETNTTIHKKPRRFTNLSRGTYLSEGFSILKIIIFILLIASITSFLFSGNGTHRTFYDFFNYLFTFPGVSVDWLLNPDFLSIDGTGFGNFIELIGLDFLFNALLGVLKLAILLPTLILNAFSFLTHLILYFV